MIKNPISKLREIAPTRRRIRTRLRRMERLTLRHAHKFIVQRFANLRSTRRHALGWLLLVCLLSGLAFWQSDVTAQQYTKLAPAEGGVYTEGAFGALDNINPIFVATSAERSA